MRQSLDAFRVPLRRVWSNLKIIFGFPVKFQVRIVLTILELVYIEVSLHRIAPDDTVAQWGSTYCVKVTSGVRVAAGACHVDPSGCLPFFGEAPPRFCNTCLDRICTSGPIRGRQISDKILRNWSLTLLESSKLLPPLLQEMQSLLPKLCEYI